MALSLACKLLQVAVSASKWHPFSPLPAFAPDGTASEPLSGRFNVICKPEQGGGGIQRAIRDCPLGGSVLLREGVYYVDQPICLNRTIHVFGRGRAVVRGRVPPGTNFLEIALPRSLGDASPATLDRLRLDNHSQSRARTVLARSGRARLQTCIVSSLTENELSLIRAEGAGTSLDLFGCTLRQGGGVAASYGAGALGTIEGCDVGGFWRASGFAIAGEGTAPYLAHNTIHDCKEGVSIYPTVDPAWSLGEGNVFANCPAGNILDKRAAVVAAAAAGGAGGGAAGAGVGAGVGAGAGAAAAAAAGPP